MNDAYYHLILNHLPITFVALGLVVLISGFLFKSAITKRISYLVFIAAALFGFTAFYTGERAKKLVQGIKLIDERLVSVHEESALMFLSLLYFLGALSLFALWADLKKKPFLKATIILIFITAITALYFAAQAGITGGDIRHTEILQMVK